MASDRRFSQKEIAAIFKKASEEQERIKESAAGEDGLTLEDLHQIAKEAGIAPELITAAARGVERAIEAPPEKRFMGFATTVHRIVDLNGELTDEDWDKLVIEIRQAFSARGKITREGGLREWSNGNLHILVEPTQNGHRLRMGTEKQSAKGFFFASLSWIAVAMFLLLQMAMSDVDFSVLFPAIIFATAGLAGIGFTGMHLSQWRYDRADQMDAIASKAIDMISRRDTSLQHAPVHEDVLMSHERDLSNTVGLDTEFFDRTTTDNLLGLEETDDDTSEDALNDAEKLRSNRSRS